MTEVLLWLFFLADLVGIAWAVRVLVREARKHLTWYLRDRHLQVEVAPAEAVAPEPPAARPAPSVPQQRSAPAPRPVRPSRSTP